MEPGDRLEALMGFLKQGGDMATKLDREICNSIHASMMDPSNNDLPMGMAIPSVGTALAMNLGRLLSMMAGTEEITSEMTDNFMDRIRHTVEQYAKVTHDRVLREHGPKAPGGDL